MSKGNTFENDLVKLIFNGTTINNLAQNDATTPATVLYLSLHTSDPGEAGGQSTNETSYGAYARVSVNRTASGFSVSGNAVTLAATASFPAATAGTATITHFAVGTANTGAGKLMYSGTVSPNIAVSSGVTPKLTTSTSISED